MTFAARTLGAGSAAFVPVTRTYTSGSGTESAPLGATKVTITNQAAGAGGYFTLTPSESLGGGAGGEGIKTVSVIGGNTLSYAVGSGSAANSNLPGGNSSVSGTVAGGAVNMVAQGGGGAFAQNGGPSSGGDTNITGGPGSGSSGGTSPYGVNYGNGGNSFQAGQGGIITFAYT